MSNKPQHYYKLRKLLPFYGREFIVDRDFPQGMARMRASDLILKFPRPKTGVYRYTRTSRNIEDYEVFSELGPQFAHELHEQNKVIIQEWRPLCAEYRIIIFAGEPVTGSACDMHLTSLHNEDRFDKKLDMSLSQIHQKHKTEADTLAALTHNPHIVEQYVKLAEEILAVVPEWPNFVLDLAFDMEREVPLLLEINPPWKHRINFYACDPEQVARLIWI